MSEMGIRAIFQRLAFELRALKIDDPIEIYIGKTGYNILIDLLTQTQMMPSDKEHEGLLIYDKIWIRHKEKLDFDRKSIDTLRKRTSQALADLAVKIDKGWF